MSADRPSSPFPNCLFRGYQISVVVIVLVYALILVVLISTGLFVNTAGAIRLAVSLFLIYLAPGTLMLAFAAFLATTGRKPGPIAAKISFPAAFWTIVAGYNVVLT